MVPVAEYFEKRRNPPMTSAVAVAIARADLPGMTPGSGERCAEAARTGMPGIFGGKLVADAQHDAVAYVKGPVEIPEGGFDLNLAQNLIFEYVVGFENGFEFGAFRGCQAAVKQLVNQMLKAGGCGVVYRHIPFFSMQVRSCERAR